jgi:hypothetical protein
MPWRGPRILDRGAAMTKKAKTTRITDDMKIVVLKKANPFTKGSEIFERAQWVLNAHNKTVGHAKRDRDGTVVRWLLNNGFIKVVAAK